MKKRVLEVVAGVVFDGKNVLACQRPEGKPVAGFWEFPGGKVEAGETLACALDRELSEELAMQVTILDEMYRLEINEPEKTLVLHFLRALKNPGSEPVACENQQFRWLEPAELMSVNWLPTDEEFVNMLIKAHK